MTAAAESSRALCLVRVTSRDGVGTAETASEYRWEYGKVRDRNRGKKRFTRRSDQLYDNTTLVHYIVFVYIYNKLNCYYHILSEFCGGGVKSKDYDSHAACRGREGHNGYKVASQPRTAERCWPTCRVRRAECLQSLPQYIITLRPCMQLYRVFRVIL